MTERVLITGASGFLGFHLIEAALGGGLEVHAAVRRNSDVKHLQHFNIKYTYPDFNSISSLKNELEKYKFHYIIHAAGITKAGSHEEYNKINRDITYKVGKAAAMADIPLKKFVFVSSLAAIGPLQNAAGILTEDTEPRPVTSYGKSKLSGEERLVALALPLTIIRPTAVYGPREKDILIFFKTISKGWEPYIGKRPQQLSFVYVKDVADVIIKALFNEQHHSSYNISDGHSYGRYELADNIKILLNRRTRRIHLPERIVKATAGILEKTYAALKKTPALNREKLNELTATNWNCSIEKAYKELGFKPAYNLKDGLAETINWYKNNNWI